MGVPPPPVFWQRSLELIENNGVDFFVNAKQFVKV
jgi:hypothetical protein